MPRSPEEEQRPIEDVIKVFHDALKDILKEAGVIQHSSLGKDVLAYARPYKDITGKEIAENIFAILAWIPCANDHDSESPVRDIPSDTVILTGFKNDPYHLEVREKTSRVVDNEENPIRAVSQGILRHYLYSVKATINNPKNRDDGFTFSDN